MLALLIVAVGADPTFTVTNKCPVPCVCGTSEQCKCASGVCPGGCPVESVRWTEDYYDACVRRDETGKSVVMLFSDLEGCVPCRALEALALQDPEVKAALAKMITVRVNVRTSYGRNLASRFGVTSWPRVLVYRDKKLVGDVSGNVSAATLLDAIIK